MTSPPSGSLPPEAARPDHSPSRKTPPPQSRPLPKDKASAFTRAGALWSSLIGGFLILILLLIFIAQNTAPTPFTFLGWHWTLPLGVAILLAAVVGGLITVAVGTARIIQLRHAAKKNLTAGVR
ncbi:MAG: lipopolysaccharide assembly protein LapA domain-containing protein [Mycobacteriaceae bacterium]|nr:lipopolysaccharide assembly protein LapA domain-containing protein [Mycobacteriaceae bacterium]